MGEQRVSDRDAGQVHVVTDHARRVNWAMHHNAVPLIRRVEIQNLGDDRIEELTVVLWSDSGAVPETRLEIAAMDGGSRVQLDSLDVRLDGQLLVNQTERVSDQLWTEVRQGEEVLCRGSGDLEVLAYDEWNGAQSLPELLAAFVLPNHPAIERMLSAASQRLSEWGGDGSLSGYQSGDSDRVRKTAAAIYYALADLDIRYASPPASFEETGQRIRTPERVLESKLATCLDISTVLSAALEQSGLHPLLLLVEGHAFVGVWLEEDQLPFPATDDPLPIRKRIDVGELVAFDSSSAVQGASFEQAEAQGRSMLQDVGQFRLAVDVAAARAHRIHPLPSRVMGDGFELTGEGDTVSVSAAAPAERPEISAAHAPVPDTDRAQSRVERWKGKLLDLTLRNRLLNFRPSKQTVPIVSPNLPRLEDDLADGRAFLLQPKPDAFSGDDLRDVELLSKRSGDDPVVQMLLEQERAGHLHTALTELEVGRRLKTIARAARTSIEEKGANTLYIALGFLHWYDKPGALVPRKAPLLLLPAVLERDSARAPFRVRLADDEPRVNTTLLQLLEREHGIQVRGLDELPLDDHGLDVPLIFQRFRKAVLDVGRWEVVEEAWLGLFSFTKYLMWLDLEARRDSLIQTPVVRHLLADQDESWDDSKQLPDPAGLERRHAGSLLCPMDADSSQQAAIYGAADGCSFVIQGPPGTGKSQTITNLIAHSLANRRTVLFVSEKMAALEVVHERLRQVGLGPFCLQLHSDKTTKMEVARQLGDAMQVSRSRPAADWIDHANKLQSLREYLSLYANELHRPRSFGLSYYQAVSALVGLRDAPVVDLDFGGADAVDVERFTALNEAVDRLQYTAREVGSIPDHPWRFCGVAEWRPDLAGTIRSQMGDLDAAAQKLQTAIGTVAGDLSLPTSGYSAQQLSTLAVLAETMCQSPGVNVHLLTEPHGPARIKQIEVWIGHGERARELWSGLTETYSDKLLGLPLDQLKAQFDKWSNAFFILAWIFLYSARRAVREVCRRGMLPPNRAIAEDLERAVTLQEENNALSEAKETATALLGPHWREQDTDWAALRSMLPWVTGVRAVLQQIMGWDAGSAIPRRDRIAQLTAAGPEMVAPETPLGSKLGGFQTAWSEYQQKLDELCELLVLDRERAFNREDHLQTVRDAIASWRQNEHLLRQWTAWMRAAQAATKIGLEPVVVAHNTGAISVEQLRQSYEKGIFTWWTGKVAGYVGILGHFHGIEHNRQVERFQEIDRSLVRMARDQVRAELAARIPRASDGSGGEMGLLQRELKKKRRHLPTRKLFKAIPHVLQRLKPCVLMSPISVAQYLDPELEGYDLVVFDEASQIPPWDAIGAMARGEQTVVVGDSKQLPPTSFFQRGESEDEISDEEDRIDLESILDECIAVGMPTLTLDWHFRSRHESLIVFSNRKYYGNRLHTFPSAEFEVEHLGVHWRYVEDGLYERGRTRYNRPEAQALVKEVLRRLLDPERYPGSIGIVTFSQAQQSLIEDLLEDARSEKPEVEKYFRQSDEVQEPVFVKNLENVQGDERDVMFFSIGYGPDQDGRISMNFGPLTRVGGERRLNVAITRARRQLNLYSSIHGDQIDLNRTRARGVADLKDFLNYAEHGVEVLAESSAGRDEPSANNLPLESDVCRALQEKGYQINIRVGCMGYRIDLGVRDPDREGCYLLGVECDGPTYFGARGARDRDRLRQQVLEGLGWRLHRVWSTDWLHDPHGELARIERAIEASEQDQSQRLKQAQMASNVADASGDRKNHTSPARESERVEPSREANTSQMAPPMRDDRPAEGIARPSGRLLRAASMDGEEEGAAEYRAYEVPICIADFYDRSQSVEIAKALGQVIRRESPVHVKLAAKRVSEAYGLKRVTKRVLKRTDEVSRFLSEKWAPTRSGDFFWWSEQDPSTYREYRIPGDSRAADLIPPEEIANATYAVLIRSIALQRDELARLTAKELRLRAGKKVVQAMQEGIALLVKQGRCTIDGDKVSMR